MKNREDMSMPPPSIKNNYHQLQWDGVAMWLTFPTCAEQATVSWSPEKILKDDQRALAQMIMH